MTSTFFQATVDLGTVRRNAESIRWRVGVPLIAVVKANAYGLGARPVAESIADLVERFCMFSLAEANDYGLPRLTGKPGMTLGPAESASADDLLAAHVRPAVWNVEQAAAFRAARPILCVDTGMQRFACPPAQVDAALFAGECDEAFTHATRIEHVEQLMSLVGGRGLRLHAAGSTLLDQPAARLDKVRPGIALYRGAAQVVARIVETRDSGTPAGYGGFVVPRFGVILGGYARGIRKGICLVNGSRRTIVEVGMQSAFVEIGPDDRAGDSVFLLGDGLTEAEVGRAWGTSEQEVLVRLVGHTTALGQTRYVGP